MGKAFTHQQFLDRLASFDNNIEPLTQYVNKRTKIKMKCNTCGHEWECVPSHLLKGSGCPMCGRKKSGEKHRLSHEQFISQIPDSIEILDTYEKYGQIVRCRCKVCGYEWSNKPEYLIKNKGCPKCLKQIKYTNNSFKQIIEEKNSNIEVLGNYKEVNTNGNIECKCRICGHIWYPNVIALKRGQNCPECTKRNMHDIFAKTTGQFIEDAKKVHGDKYDYSKVDYINNSTKVIITCPIHGDFEQLAGAHLQGQGCAKCAYEQRGLALRRSNEDFIKIANSVHNSKYTYDKCQYITKRDKVIITCPTHGDFEQLAGNHLKGAGCPHCRSSKGETLVQNILKQYKIPHKYQYTLKHTINNRKVIVDFVCIYNNKKYIIEYNGIQHYEPIEFFGGQNAFELQKIRDEGIRNLCNEYNIKLIEIHYTLNENEIEILLKKEFEIE